MPCEFNELDSSMNESPSLQPLSYSPNIIPACRLLAQIGVESDQSRINNNKKGKVVPIMSTK